MMKVRVLVALSLALVAAFAAFGQGSPLREGELRDSELIGKLEVNFRADRDILQVGLRDGLFRRLILQVEGNELEIEKLVVTFADGSSQELILRHLFKEGSRSRALDLEGRRRVIKSVAFVYRTTGRLAGGRASIELRGIK